VRSKRIGDLGLGFHIALLASDLDIPFLLLGHSFDNDLLNTSLSSTKLFFHDIETAITVFFPLFWPFLVYFDFLRSFHLPLFSSFFFSEPSNIVPFCPSCRIRDYASPVVWFEKFRLFSLFLRERVSFQSFSEHDRPSPFPLRY